MEEQFEDRRNMPAAILGSPVMIDAYKAGILASGRHFQDGSKMTKVHWNARKNETAPGEPTVPGTHITMIS